MKRTCKWKPEWSRYNLTPSKRETGYVNCSVCLTEFSIAGGGGFHEIKRHMETKWHKERAKSTPNQSTITSSFASSSYELDEQVTTAEFYYTAFIAEHNLSFASADHFTKLCKVMFLIAKLPKAMHVDTLKPKLLLHKLLLPILSAMQSWLARLHLFLSSVMVEMTRMLGNFSQLWSGIGMSVNDK